MASAALALTAALATCTGMTAHADPADLIDPKPDPPLYLPTPLGDPWFNATSGFEATAPGTVLRDREVSIPSLSVSTRTTQLLFRSTDSKDRPIAAATSVIVPTAPWTGGGPRPVISYNFAIDSLGNTCAPSYTLPRGTGAEVNSVASLLERNFAVVVTDYQGPRQAYSAGLVSGHTVLDSLRAAVNRAELGLRSTAPIGITGYSGGAIASGWAAQLAPHYAPELNIVGVALGGPPTDYTILHRSLNGQIGSGLYLAASTGLAREYPELLRLYNANGLRLMQVNKDQCGEILSVQGIFMLPIEALAKDQNSFTDPVIRDVIAENRMGAKPPRAPIFIYQGLQDYWIPKEGAENLQNEWCAAGASVRLEELPGDHPTVSTTGKPIAFDWLADRLSGTPAAAGCSTVIR
nr:lipase family protein [Antrihabitans stalactiti]